MFAQYLRLGVSVYDSNRTVIKRSYTLLNAIAKTREKRLARHKFIGSMLDYHKRAINLYRTNRLGF